MLAQNVWAQLHQYYLLATPSNTPAQLHPPSFLPAWTALPRLEAQLGKGQKEHPEEQQTRAREVKARAQVTGKPGAEPYGVTWALANLTPCLVIATARYSYIDSYIDSFIVENDIVETMVMVAHTNYFSSCVVLKGCRY